MVELIRKSEELKKIPRIENSLIGIVPTMGNLHTGHISLICKSIEENEITVVTIFVNPKQFGENEDFNDYPRTLEHDVSLIEKVAKKPVFIFAPDSVEEIFPKNFSTNISLGKLAIPLCGMNRPGHFDGVATVVYRLFSLIHPNNAYFGQKDYQQLKIITQMVEDLMLNIQVKGLETVRDEDGLALSSRNRYLNSEERRTALTLPKTLSQLAEDLESMEFEDSFPVVRKKCKMISESPQWDYLEILDADLLIPPTTLTKKVIIAGAYRVGKARLIDNKIIKVNNV